MAYKTFLSANCLIIWLFYPVSPMLCPRIGIAWIRVLRDCTTYFRCVEGQVTHIESCPINTVFSLSAKMCVWLGSDEDDCSKTNSFKILLNETSELTTVTSLRRDVKQIQTPKELFHGINPTKEVMSARSSQKARKKTTPVRRIKAIRKQDAVKPSTNISHHNVSRWTENKTMTSAFKKLQDEYDATEEDTTGQDYDNDEIYNQYHHYYYYYEDNDEYVDDMDISYQWSKEEEKTTDDTCGFSVSAFIIGGRPAHEGTWPWQVSLQVRTDPPSHRCGGVFIHPSWILTAAHCVYRAYSSPRIFQVVLADLDLMNDSGFEVYRSVQKIIVHENYGGGGGSGGYPNDIALLKLSNSVEPFENYVNIVCLPNQEEEFDGNDQCHMTGWGKTMGTGSRWVLNELETSIRSVDYCHSLWAHNYVEHSHLCVGDGTTGACQGDSGVHSFASDRAGCTLLALHHGPLLAVDGKATRICSQKSLRTQIGSIQ